MVCFTDRPGHQVRCWINKRPNSELLSRPKPARLSVSNVTRTCHFENAAVLHALFDGPQPLPHSFLH